MTDAQLSLRAAGKALYGPRWQRNLAKDLHVSERTMRYWAAGKDVPDSAWPALARLCQIRAQHLGQVSRELAQIAHELNEI